MNWKRISLSLSLVSALALPTVALSAAIDILQGSLFVSTSGNVYQDDQVGFFDPTGFVAPAQVNNFGGSGLDLQFENNLAADPSSPTFSGGPAFTGGALSWRITNNTGANITDAHIMGYLDAEFPGAFDIYGATLGDLSPYDSWEIDDAEPGFGNILNNASVVGRYDDTNSVPITSPDVGFAFVALGLGIDVSDWMAGETILATFMLTDIGGQSTPAGNGLALLDLNDPDNAFLYSASVENIGVIPIPGSGGLMLTGLASLLIARYRLKKNTSS